MKISPVLLGMAFMATSAFAHEHGTVKIYDAKFKPEIFALNHLGRLVLEDGEKTVNSVPKDAYAAHENLTKIRDYFYKKFGRRSWDDKASDIIASVNLNLLLSPFDWTGMKENAAWGETRFVFGAGSQKGFDNLPAAMDIVAHEYTHAVIQTTSNLKYEGQSGALNEHLADVFGSIINNHYNHPANPYLFGASVISGANAKKADAIRDMMEPLKGLTPQPSHMAYLSHNYFKEYGSDCKPTVKNDRCGVHLLSGIPNRMAALVMSVMGSEAAAPLFYNVMTKRLTENSNFADYRIALMDECRLMGPRTCAIVDGALRAVGM